MIRSSSIQYHILNHECSKWWYHTPLQYFAYDYNNERNGCRNFSPFMWPFREILISLTHVRALSYLWPITGICRSVILCLDDISKYIGLNGQKGVRDSWKLSVNIVSYNPCHAECVDEIWMYIDFLSFQHWGPTGGLNPTLWKTKYFLSYMVSIMILDIHQNGCEQTLNELSTKLFYIAWHFQEYMKNIF